MKPVRFTITAGATALVLSALIVGTTSRGVAQSPDEGFGSGIPDSFLRKYAAFREAQRASGAQVLRVRLGYVKGLSRSFTSIAGDLAIDLESGSFRLSLGSLTPLQEYSVWLVDVPDIDNAGSAPDKAVRLGTVRATTASAVLTGTVAAAATELPAGFQIDRVVVASGGESPDPPLATGSVGVFQKIFFRRLSLLSGSEESVIFNEATSAPRLSNLVPDLVAETDARLTRASAVTRALDALRTAMTNRSRRLRLDRLISRGATLFFEETFDGNGRTCGTCHPASNNFTIDPDYIRSLPSDDPLFVAEFNPELAELERPQLMRAYGLILENLDGLDDPAVKFVMRSVPPTLALQTSLERDTGFQNGPVEMTGWSGDGAPGTGSLREFAIGAVTQHLTKRLARVPGRDFTLPTEHQLDAMEAFQLSLGRSTDYDLSKITFRDRNVETGRSLFINGTGDPNAGGTCGFCHQNAGALSTNGQNRNFNSNVERLSHPARSLEDFPRDGGFGQAANEDGTYGDGSFNVSPVVEAADTPPFFHNNVVNTLEEVVEFYSSPAFNASLDPSVRLSFTATQVDQLAGFMRAINTLLNVDTARSELREILMNRFDLPREQRTRLQTAYKETGDAITVLRDGGIFPDAVTELEAVRGLIQQAQQAAGFQRRSIVQRAITRLDQGRKAVATSTR